MKHVNLRLPDDLHAELAEAAKVDARSLNKEIVHLLRQALAAGEAVPPPPEGGGTLAHVEWRPGVLVEQLAAAGSGHPPAGSEPVQPHRGDPDES